MGDGSQRDGGTHAVDAQLSGSLTRCAYLPKVTDERVSTGEDAGTPAERLFYALGQLYRLHRLPTPVAHARARNRLGSKPGLTAASWGCSAVRRRRSGAVGARRTAQLRRLNDGAACGFAVAHS